MHQKNIIHHDVDDKNIIIDTKTAQITIIDINPLYFSLLTQAPEEHNQGGLGSVKADIYSLAYVFMPILSGGIRPWKEGDSIMGIDMVEKHIRKRFSFKDSKNPVSPSVAIIDQLRKMLSENPENRGTLQEAKQVFIKQLQIVTGKMLALKQST